MVRFWRRIRSAIASSRALGLIVLGPGVIAYRIDVDDLGEPGRSRDTFTIETGTGFTATGVLEAGNVQIHE